MYYKARYYHPTLGRFVSADTIVPGMANGAGGGVATLGYDPQTRLTPLTVNLGEFAQQINAENREILQFGWFFQWDARTRREHNVPRGPVNPQALNRYAYVLNNPLRYVDPTGHYLINNIDVDLTAAEVQDLLGEIDWWLTRADAIETVLTAGEAVSWLSEGIGLTEIAARISPQIGFRLALWGGTIGAETLLPLGAAGLAVNNSIKNCVSDLKDLRYSLAMASAGGSKGVHLRMGSDMVRWGIEVNGEEAIGHLLLPMGALGAMFSKGQANFTPSFMMLWWWFDYGQ